MAINRYVKFAFPISAYQPDALQNGYAEKELRAEYSRLRSIAQKRLKTLEQSEFAASQTVRYNKGRYKKLSDIESTSELSHLLGDLARFLTAQRGTVSGLRQERERAMETWREQYGVDFVQPEEWVDYSDFLEYLKDVGGVPYVDRKGPQEKSKVDTPALKRYWEEWKETGKVAVMEMRQTPDE